MQWRCCPIFFGHDGFQKTFKWTKPRCDQWRPVRSFTTVGFNGVASAQIHVDAGVTPWSCETSWIESVYYGDTSLWHASIESSMCLNRRRRNLKTWRARDKPGRWAPWILNQQSNHERIVDFCHFCPDLLDLGPSCCMGFAPLSRLHSKCAKVRTQRDCRGTGQRILIRKLSYHVADWRFGARLTLKAPWRRNPAGTFKTCRPTPRRPPRPSRQLRRWNWDLN